MCCGPGIHAAAAGRSASESPQRQGRSSVRICSHHERGLLRQPLLRHMRTEEATRESQRKLVCHHLDHLAASQEWRHVLQHLLPARGTVLPKYPLKGGLSWPLRSAALALMQPLSSIMMLIAKLLAYMNSTKTCIEQATLTGVMFD